MSEFRYSGIPIHLTYRYLAQLPSGSPKETPISFPRAIRIYDNRTRYNPPYPDRDPTIGPIHCLHQ